MAKHFFSGQMAYLIQMDVDDNLEFENYENRNLKFNLLICAYTYR